MPVIDYESIAIMMHAECVSMYEDSDEEADWVIGSGPHADGILIAFNFYQGDTSQRYEAIIDKSDGDEAAMKSHIQQLRKMTNR